MDTVCKRCGSSSVNRRGTRGHKNRYVCTNCGKWFSVSEDNYVKSPHETLELKQNGEVISDKLIEIGELDLKDPTKVLLAHGFDPNEWVIIAYRHNLWHAPVPGGQQTMYQSRVNVRPRHEDDITFADIDRFFSSFSPPKKSELYTPSHYSEDGDVLEICLADLHIDRKVYKEDKRVEQKMEETIADIIGRMPSKLSKIYFVPLGDTLDYDTYKYTTTSGTQQYSKGQHPYTAFDTNISLFIKAIDTLSQYAPVEAIFIPGNHDRTYSYMAMKALEMYYISNPNVSVDTTHDMRKYRKIGTSLVGWAHGDMLKSHAHTWIQNEARKEWGDTKYAEVHAGHYHTQTTQEKDGVILRYLPSTTDPSLWEAENGYMGNTRSTASFLWSKDRGLRAMWFTNV